MLRRHQPKPWSLTVSSISHQTLLAFTERKVIWTSKGQVCPTSSVKSLSLCPVCATQHERVLVVWGGDYMSFFLVRGWGLGTSLHWLTVHGSCECKIVVVSLSYLSLLLPRLPRHLSLTRKIITFSHETLTCFCCLFLPLPLFYNYA